MIAMNERLRNIRLRWIVNPEDAVSIQALAASTGFFSYQELEIARELVEERLANGEASGYHFVLAEDQNRLLAYTCYGPTDAAPCAFDLYWIAVLNEHRRQGLGALVLARTEERILAMGGREVFVETSSKTQYAPTRAFYKAHGYSLYDIQPCHYGPQDDLVVYAKKLSVDQRELAMGKAEGRKGGKQFGKNPGAF
jgi:ribosomal protein S18 acetylase RimI-like enzyme